MLILREEASCGSREAETLEQQQSRFSEVFAWSIASEVKERPQITTSGLILGKDSK